MKLWNNPLLFFTLSYIKVIEGSLVRKGHNHLNDLSEWTMVWLHRTNQCHICCHHCSLGSHTSMKGKKRKMSPLTHFTEKAGQVYRSPHPSLSISCLGEAGSRTLWPVWALRVPVKASVRRWMATVDILVWCLILNLIHALDYSTTCFIFSLYGKERL